MDQLLAEQDRLEKRGNLSKSIEDVQTIIDKLRSARGSIESDPSSTSLTLAKLQSPIKADLDKVNDDLKDVHSSLNKYSKAVEKKFKDSALTFAENDALSQHPDLINRAIAMHLLREGHFDVASQFMSEAYSQKPKSLSEALTAVDELHKQTPEPPDLKAWEMDLSAPASKPGNLKEQFSDMYHILHEMRTNRNLTPAIEWAREHSAVLEARGSNLEYDLCRLQYISLFISPLPGEGPLAAIEYARQTFPSFPNRYSSQTHALLGALAFTPNLDSSPYASLFSASCDSNTMSAAAAAFTSEFCALLSLSSASPLLTAVTAGCIALPRLLKLAAIQQMHRTSWTTASELPVEIPLPPGFQFHSIFVCPVSKEQSTDANPPMLMPCGHVVAKESLNRLSRGARFKCPYCPAESHPDEAKMIYL